LERLQEIVDNYDLTVEMASLNFDHEWGGPSQGWCESVWLQDDILWARFVDLSPEAVAGIQERRYVRQSAELVFDHSVTRTWYLTAVALLGNARPEVKSLPQVKLASRTIRKKEKLMSDPHPQPQTDPPTPGPADTELAALRSQVAEGAQLAARLRRQT